MKFNFNDAQPVLFFRSSCCTMPIQYQIYSPSQPFGRHVYLTLQDKFYYRPRPARIANFAQRPNCNGDSFPVLCTMPIQYQIYSPSQPFGRHVYLTLQDKFYYRPRPARIANFAQRPNCNGDSFPVLCRDYHDRSHDLIGLHMTLRQRTCSQDRATTTVQPCCTPCLFIMLAVKTGSKRMTKAYSKISGYGRKIRWIRVDASRIRKKKFAFSQISGYVWTMPKNIKCRIRVPKKVTAHDDSCVPFSGFPSLNKQPLEMFIHQPTIESSFLYGLRTK